MDTPLPTSASERLPQEGLRSPHLFAEESLNFQRPVPPAELTGNSLEARGSIVEPFPARECRNAHDRHGGPAGERPV